MASGQTNISGGKALSGTAQPNDVRMGMTYPDGKEMRTGTLDLRNLKAENIKQGVTIGGVAGEIDLIELKPENIKKGITIGGVTGTLDRKVAKVRSYSGETNPAPPGRNIIFQWANYLGYEHTFQLGDIEGDVYLKIHGDGHYNRGDIYLNGVKIHSNIEMGYNSYCYIRGVTPNSSLRVKSNDGLQSLCIAFEVIEGPQYLKF